MVEHHATLFQMKDVDTWEYILSTMEVQANTISQIWRQWVEANFLDG